MECSSQVNSTPPRIRKTISEPTPVVDHRLTCDEKPTSSPINISRNKLSAGLTLLAFVIGYSFGSLSNSVASVFENAMCTTITTIPSHVPLHETNTHEEMISWQLQYQTVMQNKFQDMIHRRQFPKSCSHKRILWKFSEKRRLLSSSNERRPPDTQDGSSLSPCHRQRR